jgi:c(7)-type cytochrome triheme protein
VGRILEKVTFWRVVATSVLLTGLYATVIRFGWGLGAATNLSDEFPWGIWVGFDVLVGVGLAAGGFTITATVHLFDLKRFRPIVRPAILTAFLGYLLVSVGLMYDLGHPYRIWHPLIMWNPHSVMFEVAWCVMLYSTVLTLEFSPMLLERFKLEKPLKVVKAITVPVVIAGVLLSMLHQSSLGTVFVIMPGKLHALWYTPMLPVFFFLSAISAGLCMVILESYMSSRAFGRRLESDILQDLGRVVVVVLALYLVVKAQTMPNLFALLADPGPERFLFIVEMGFGVIVPMVLLAIPAVRADRSGLFCSALLVVLGFVLNRLNISTAGLQKGLGASYFPSFLELSVTAMLVTAGFIAFRLAAKHLRVFPEGKTEHEAEDMPAAFRPAWVVWVSKGAVGAFAVVMLAGSYTLSPSASMATQLMAEEDLLDHEHTPQLALPEDITLPRGEDSPGPVTLSHESHVDADAPDCVVCHASSFPILIDREASRPSPGEAMHSDGKCGQCHNGEAAFEVEDNCEACHAED